MAGDLAWLEVYLNAHFSHFHSLSRYTPQCRLPPHSVMCLAASTPAGVPLNRLSLSDFVAAPLLDGSCFAFSVCGSLPRSRYVGWRSGGRQTAALFPAAFTNFLSWMVPVLHSRFAALCRGA